MFLCVQLLCIILAIEPHDSISRVGIPLQLSHSLSEQLEKLDYQEKNPLTHELLVHRHAINHRNLEVKKKEPGIYLSYKNKRYRYFQSHVYVTDGAMRIPGLVKKAAKALSYLRRKSPYAADLIATLEHSPFECTVQITNSTASYTLLPFGGRLGFLNNSAYAYEVFRKKELLVDYAPFLTIGSGCTIRWNPELQGVIQLGHELGHAYDANYGLLTTAKISAPGGYIAHRELRGLLHENQIRKELNIAIRTHMNRIQVFKNKTKEVSVMNSWKSSLLPACMQKTRHLCYQKTPTNNPIPLDEIIHYIYSFLIPAHEYESDILSACLLANSE